MLSEPKPFEEAVAAIRGRRLLPTSLGHAELQRLGPALRRRALALAGVMQVEILDKVQRDALRLVSGASRGPGDYANPATMRAGIKEMLAGLDYQPAPDRVGTISDLRTDARLNLIIDMESKLAAGRGQYIQANDPDSLRIFPCQELIRVESREVPRGYERRKEGLVVRDAEYWKTRWKSVGGQIYDGRMIARLDDPVWARLSTFGLPYPPFDFNSGMGTRLVRRSESISLGVIQNGDVVVSATGGGTRLVDEIESVPVPNVDQAFLDLLLLAGFRIEDGMLTLA